MLPLLLACTPDALLAPAMDTESFLDPAITDEIPERAWIDGPGEVTIGVQRLTHERALGASWPVYAIEDDTLGLVVDDSSVRLLVTVERAALRPVLVQRTLATPDPDTVTEGEEIGFLFPAGTSVDPDLSFHDAIPLSANSSWIEGTGWVDVGAVDVYAEVEAVSSGWAGNYALEAGTPLLEAPGGEPFAWLTREEWAQTLGEPEDGWVLVELARSDLTVRGYVQAPEQDISSIGMLSGGSSCYIIRCGGFGLGNLTPSIPAGTLLLDAPDGTPIGLALVDLYDPILDREDGFALVEVDTWWGPVAVWVE